MDAAEVVEIANEKALEKTEYYPGVTAPQSDVFDILSE
jgi:hypothetical protein